MKEMNKDLFDPRTVMEPEFEKSPREGNFGFAFNDINFSDRILRIEIMAGPSDSRIDGVDCGGDGCSSLFDWVRHRKRRRDDLKKSSAATNLCLIDNDVDANLADNDEDRVNGLCFNY